MQKTAFHQRRHQNKIETIEGKTFFCYIVILWPYMRLPPHEATWFWKICCKSLDPSIHLPLLGQNLGGAERRPAEESFCAEIQPREQIQIPALHQRRHAGEVTIHPKESYRGYILPQAIGSSNTLVQEWRGGQEWAPRRLGVECGERLPRLQWWRRAV